MVWSFIAAGLKLGAIVRFLRQVALKRTAEGISLKALQLFLFGDVAFILQLFFVWMDNGSYGSGFDGFGATALSFGAITCVNLFAIGNIWYAIRNIEPIQATHREQQHPTIKLLRWVVIPAIPAFLLTASETTSETGSTQLFFSYVSIIWGKIAIIPQIMLYRHTPPSSLISAQNSSQQPIDPSSDTDTDTDTDIVPPTDTDTDTDTDTPMNDTDASGNGNYFEKPGSMFLFLIFLSWLSHLLVITEWSDPFIDLYVVEYQYDVFFVMSILGTIYVIVEMLRWRKLYIDQNMIVQGIQQQQSTEQSQRAASIPYSEGSIAFCCDIALYLAFVSTPFLLMLLISTDAILAIVPLCAIIIMGAYFSYFQKHPIITTNAPKVALVSDDNCNNNNGSSNNHEEDIFGYIESLTTSSDLWTSDRGTRCALLGALLVSLLILGLTISTLDSFGSLFSSVIVPVIIFVLAFICISKWKADTDVAQRRRLQQRIGHTNGTELMSGDGEGMALEHPLLLMETGPENIAAGQNENDNNLEQTGSGSLSTAKGNYKAPLLSLDNQNSQNKAQYQPVMMNTGAGAGSGENENENENELATTVNNGSAMPEGYSSADRDNDII